MNLINIYKDLHRIPELAFKEKKTKKYLIEILEQHDIEYEDLKSGIVAKITVNNGKYIGFRAELDALNVKETNKIDFRSTDKMHACGHDMHMSIILGIIIEAKKNISKLKKNVIFAFQSAEETGSGAKSLISEYFWPEIQEFYAFHNSNIIDINNVGLQKGQINSYIYDFDIVLKGKSAHVAQPYLGKDALTCATSFINSIRINQNSHFGAHKQYSINFTNINTKNDNNRICDNVKLSGTIRVASLDIQENVVEFFEYQLSKICELSDIKFTIKTSQIKSLINSERIHNELVYKLDSYVLMDSMSSGGDDFSEFSQLSKIYLLKIGSKWEDESLNQPIHQGNFLPNYYGIEYGVKIGLTILNINK